MQPDPVNLEQLIGVPQDAAASPLIPDPLGRERLTTTLTASRPEAIAAAFNRRETATPQVGVWRWELDNDRIVFSARARGLLASRCGPLPVDAPLFLHRLPPSDRHALLLAMLAVLRGGPPMALEVTIRGPRPTRVRMELRRCPGGTDRLMGTVVVLASEGGAGAVA